MQAPAPVERQRSGARERHIPPACAAPDIPEVGRGRRVELSETVRPAVPVEASARGEGAAGTLARRFRGEFRQKVDAKGRISIPAHFRRVLEAGDPGWSEGKSPEFVIVYGDNRRKYLECYTLQAIGEVDDKIAAMPRGSMERRMLEKLFSGHSMQTNVDDTGRIVLSKKLRDKIGLDDEAFFIATGDTFQLWKPETYDREEQARTEEWLGNFPEDFDPLTLLERPREE